jgi:hypothetical protein
LPREDDFTEETFEHFISPSLERLGYSLAAP